ncbi:MAG: hypothetical protein F6K21_05135 [Symploca sp. SIO2D2]|nr:hypothetical protein [Symploca sp. SIO2D2]
MAYTDSNNRLLSPQQNPYAAFGSASAVAGQDFRHPIAEIEEISNLIERVRYILKYQTEPIRFFFAGDYGSGKSARLNLVRREIIQNDSSICIPIRFQEVVHDISLAKNHKLTELTNLYGMILQHIMDSLLSQNCLHREECQDLLKKAHKTQFIDLVIELFKATYKKNILLIFDEVEILFSSLDINISQFMTFMHSLSEQLFSINSVWGICVSVTGEYLIDIKREATQLKDGRFDFITIEHLSPVEVKEYVEKKNCHTTQRYNDKAYPFDEEVVEFISVVSGGLPRYIEVICHLLWSSKAEEVKSGIVDIQTARRVFTNKYKAQASAYFSYISQQRNLSREIEAFFNLLFLEGGYKLSVKELISRGSYNRISYFYQLTDSQVNYVLSKKVSKILRDKLYNEQDFPKIIEIYRSKSYLFSLTNLAYKNIYNFELT